MLSLNFENINNVMTQILKLSCASFSYVISFMCSPLYESLYDALYEGLTEYKNKSLNSKTVVT